MHQKPLLYYSVRQEPLPKVFQKYLNKEKDKNLQKLQQQAFSSPAKSTQKFIFSTPKSTIQIPKILVFHTPQPNPTTFKVDEDYLQQDYASVSQDPTNNQVKELQAEQFDLINSIQQEEKMLQPMPNVKVEPLAEIHDSYSKLIQELQVCHQEALSHMRVHTKQFLQLLAQCLEISIFVSESSEKPQIQKRLNILSNLINYFATVLPELEGSVIRSYVQRSIELTEAKLSLL